MSDTKLTDRNIDNITPDYGDFPLAELLAAYRSSSYRIPGFDLPEDTPQPEDDETPAPSPEPEEEEPARYEAEPPERPRPRRDFEERGEPRRPRPKSTGARPASFTERFVDPVVRFAATKIAQRQQRYAEAANWPDPLDIRETPELTPKKAEKFYASLIRPLMLRCRVAAFLCVILAWISFQLPMAGMLGASLELQAGVSLVATLAVMVAALDIVAAGFRQLLELRPGAEALASVSALLSCLDALLVLFGAGDKLPFCAITGISLCFALWGERLTCTAMYRTFKTARSSHQASVLSTQPLGEKGDALRRSERGSMDGLVRRSEEEDLCRRAYAVAAPILLLLALVLSIIASVGEGGRFLHTLSAIISVSASFTAFISFPLPYALASRRLKSSGAALAGYAGCADISKMRRIVVTDEDIFPPGAMRFSEINVLEGVYVGKVVACTASLLAAYGSGVSALFDELVERRGYNVPNVADFGCHEGGGLFGAIDGEQVQVGSVSYMNLMGIRLPTNMQTKNTICTAIDGELVGVFAIEYVPVTSVQDALVTLMRGRVQAIFAIRDFNITPAMIRQLLRVPAERFSFPSFRTRFRIASEDEADERPIDAVFSRAGLLPMVEALETGRRLYSACRTNTILTLAGAAAGMLIMFLLCRAGAFDTASAGSVLLFLLLWSLPVVLLSWGSNRQ